jgi:hypothetical protein
VSAAREKAERIRRDSERELSAATARRDSITSQLSNVRQMLATLGGASMVGTLDEQDAAHAERLAQEASAEDAQAAPEGEAAPDAVLAQDSVADAEGETDTEPSAEAVEDADSDDSAEDSGDEESADETEDTDATTDQKVTSRR